MKTTRYLLIGIFFLSVLIPSIAISQSHTASAEIKKLENPITVEYLKSNLRKSQPRLVINAELEKLVKAKLKTDPVVQNMYKALQLQAATITKEPLLERVVVGRRLLATSREMLYRMNVLGMVYRMEKDQKILNRINDEVLAVSKFSDWNPSHYLDVAEMSMAVAIALDWTAGKLPASTVSLAKTALIEKGIKPSYNKEGNVGWINGKNNWNQVCNGGMIAASIAIAETDPDLAAQTLSRSLNGIPNALVEYMPDGVYPEGSTYWSYGTSFSVMTAAMLESAFGTDFGLGNYPGFKESAVFRVLMNTPSGWYYNFADCGDQRGEEGDVTLAWFATKTGNKAFFEQDRFLQPVDKMGKLSRISGAALVWLSQYSEKPGASIPTEWKGDGDNPVTIFTGGDNDPKGYYFGGKGGHATTSHGNMDAGSFIFELNGVRWVIDPGNQGYNELEQAGFNLWGNCQDCQRWTLLTKSNFGHSTITVNDGLFINTGHAPLLDFKSGNKPESTFDLTALYGENMKKVTRRFVKDSPTSLTIEDNLELSEKTQSITWQLLTQADVEIVKDGAMLTQNGQKLRIENLSHPGLTISVISLYPAPIMLDRQMEGLKRLEIRIPAWTVEGGKTSIKVRLAGE
jgi:hypothetical protein